MEGPGHKITTYCSIQFGIQANYWNHAANRDRTNPHSREIYARFIHLSNCGTIFGIKKQAMATKKIIYPKSLKDIPPWRRRQITRF
ncbi:MAG: hypothetical protein JW836_12935 [Deltaproteobacteria bacterium]|nr:hypothetical protein [Deltaproteobacteria bacterium]